MTGCRPSLDRHWGWVIVLSSFLMYLISTGSLGLFVLLYVYLEREFQGSATATGWIGSLGMGLLNLMSFASSPLYEWFGHRKIIIAGVVLASVGMLATSFTHALWQIYLTYGILFAVGLNFICNPSVNMTARYFPGKTYARACLLTNSGQSVGTLVLTPLFEAAFSQIGWRKSLQILSAAIFLTCLPMSLVYKPPSPKSIKLDQADPTEEREGEPCPPRDKEEVCELEESVSVAERRRLGEREEEPNADTDITGDECVSPEMATTTFISSKDEKSPMSEAIGDDEKARDEKVESVRHKEKLWKKYITLAKDPRHGFFFLGIMLATVTIMFSGVNLISCMTVGGIAESTAAWLITLLCVIDVVLRFFLSVIGTRLPDKSLLLAAACVLGVAGALLLSLGTSLWIFVVYSVIAGIKRAIVFGTGFPCAVELFGDNRAVESLTTTQIAYGIGGLLASSVAGLSYDLTGSYQATHYTCLGIWLFSGVLFVIVYKWKLLSAYYGSHNRANRARIQNDV